MKSPFDDGMIKGALYGKNGCMDRCCVFNEKELALVDLRGQEILFKSSLNCEIEDVAIAKSDEELLILTKEKDLMGLLPRSMVSVYQITQENTMREVEELRFSEDYSEVRISRDEKRFWTIGK